MEKTEEMLTVLDLRYNTTKVISRRAYELTGNSTREILKIIDEEPLKPNPELENLKKEVEKKVLIKKKKKKKAPIKTIEAKK